MPRDLSFCTPFWREICRRKWWSSSLHVTRSSFMLTFSDTFRWNALISMENKSNRKEPLPFLISAKQRKASCFVLMLRLVDLIFLLWYESFVHQSFSSRIYAPRSLCGLCLFCWGRVVIVIETWNNICRLYFFIDRYLSGLFPLRHPLEVFLFLVWVFRLIDWLVYLKFLQNYL